MMKAKGAATTEGGLSLGAGSLIVLAFFLPMFRGCGRFDCTGFQAAQRAPVLYVSLLTGILAILAGLALLRAARRWHLIVEGAAAALALLQLAVQSIRYRLDPDFRGVQPLIGFWLLFLGLGILASYPWYVLLRGRPRKPAASPPPLVPS